MNERERALLVLRAIQKNAIFASVALQADADRHGGSPYVRYLVLAVLRWRSQIDFIIEHLAKRSLAKLDEPVVELLRLGLAQLMYLDAPAYATVSETMNLAGRYALQAKGLVNAVLRSATRISPRELVPAGNSAHDIAIREGHPEWMVRRWIEAYGVDRTAAIARANQTLSYPDLVLNPSRRDEAEKAIACVSHEPSPLVPGMVRLRESSAPLQEAIDAGLVYPMDEGSALIGMIAANAGREILDLAAAPGGKTLVMSLTGARVISHDVSISRVQVLRNSAPRFLGVNPRIVIGDGREPAFRRTFQTVLLDAPCSATGTIRKNLEIKWRLKQSDLSVLATLQAELLAAALTLTRERCIYSTCSLEREENDEVVDRVLTANPAFVRDDVSHYADNRLRPWIEDGVLRLTPDAGTDGFTAFVLRRK